MQKIKYADMHCDTASVACNAGKGLKSFNGQINLKKLNRAGCGVQCFALYTEGESAPYDFERYLTYFKEQINTFKGVVWARSYGDLQGALNAGKTAAVLTVENLGFTGGDLNCIDRLYKEGVRMVSLVWNSENAYALPNLVTPEGGFPNFFERQPGGLKEAGIEAVERLNKNKIIIDVSHLSDGGLDDILNISSAPVVASHSCCNGVTTFFRNLTDGQIKRLADKGGIAGLNFCRDFIGGGDAFERIYLHFEHMLNLGGEDLPAFGSDFDGIPPYPQMATCLKMQPLLKYFLKRGVKPRVIEKLALGNFLRVYKEVVG